MPKILVVEDHLETLDVLTIWLEQSDFTVVAARDGQEALALLLKENPDLLITDCVMPECDGIELIKRIRGSGPLSCDIPIIMLTGYAGDVADNAFAAGADRVLSKTTNPDIIVANVKNSLDPDRRGLHK